MGRICQDIDCVVEILGRCRGDYCQAERLGLAEEARREARRRGHVMSPFKKLEGRAIWQAECERCGLRAAIALSAKAGELSVRGEALGRPCLQEKRNCPQGRA